MAEFLTTTGTSHFIEQLIISATKDLILVTPYLKLTQNLVERISDAEKKGIRITIIYGKDELPKQEMKRLLSFKNIQIYFCKNLHAKCYHNESSMIITSMNLYEFSERNNREMGILIEKNKDADIFYKALNEIESIKNNSILQKEFEVQETKTKETKIDIESKQEQFELDPNFHDQYNFYLPTLFKALKEKYPEKEIVFDESIQINKFPFSGMTLKIHGRIDLIFGDLLNHKLIKERNKEIDKSLPEIRFYWNYSRLNIYPEKDFKVEIDKVGLKMITEKYLQIIDHVYKNFRIG